MSGLDGQGGPDDSQEFVYELRQWDDDKYYTVGMFASLVDALEVLDARGDDPPEIFGDSEERIDLTIYQVPIGLGIHVHDATIPVYGYLWEEQYDEVEDDYSFRLKHKGAVNTNMRLEERSAAE